MNEAKKIILFDGVCNLCNGFIQFVIKRDPNGRFMYAALQSEKGGELFEKHRKPEENFDSIGYLRKGNLTFKSTAVLNILRDIGGAWALTSVFFIVPKLVRDWVYDIVARNRYRWFGRRDECMIPTPDLQRRFLD